MKELISSLARIAYGRHPESDKPLPDDSVAHRPETIRLLFALIQEFEGGEPTTSPILAIPKKKSRRQIAREQKQESTPNNRPKKTNLYWSARELTRMLVLYHKSVSISEIARQTGRPERAVAMKLHELGIISLEHAEACSNQSTEIEELQPHQ